MSLLVAILATYRVSYMIVAENGFFDVFIKLRSRIYHKFGNEHWLTQGILCVLCVSFWLSWIAAYFIDGTYWLNALAVAGGVMVTHKLVHK